MNKTEEEAFAMPKTEDSDQPKGNGVHQLEQVTIAENGTKPKAPIGHLDLLYQIDDVPSFFMCILLGLQQYLTAFGSNLVVPHLMASSAFCMAGDTLAITKLIGTSFFVSGVASLFQTTLGVRLPIMQGSSFSFITPAIALFSSHHWKCPYSDPAYNVTESAFGSEEHQEIWQARLREFQGCLMVASLVQIFIGFSGLMEVFLCFVGPLTIMPTITLIGLSLFEVASRDASGNWFIALLVVVLVALFSQYLKNINIPCVSYNRKECFVKAPLPIFKMFPVLLAIFIVWILCYIFTVTDVFQNEEGKWGYLSRTDRKANAIHSAPWFYFPYPGQWGMPTVSLAGVLGILAGTFCILIESVGDYYACARLTGVPPPPVHSVNRGIGLEGFMCVLAGAWGAASGNTSYSENVGAIGITKVASRRVIQVGALAMMVLGCFGKFGAFFVTIPPPLVGGIYLSLFGMVAAVGISNLRFVSLDSSRNLFVIGTSLIMGLAIPFWMKKNPGVIDTGSPAVDQILAVLLGTNMFVGGFVGLFLDNTLSGTDEERGMSLWRGQGVKETASGGMTRGHDVYNLPNFIQRFLDKFMCLKYVPFCPAYNSYITKLIPKLCSHSCRCCGGNQKKGNLKAAAGSDVTGDEMGTYSCITDSKQV